MRILAATLALSALMAASGAQAQAKAQRPIDVRLRAYQEPVRLDTLVLWTVINAPPARTYTALREILELIKVPVDAADSVGGVLLKDPFITRREILRKPMSWALNCGQSINGLNADTYRIHMAYAMFVEPTVDRQQTRLGTALAAGASTTEGSSKPPVGCGSTGAFEREIAMLVKARVQVQQP